jgi:hypothetical protein
MKRGIVIFFFYLYPLFRYLMASFFERVSAAIAKGCRESLIKKANSQRRMHGLFETGIPSRCRLAVLGQAPDLFQSKQADEILTIAFI